MADRRISQDNILRQAIREQLEEKPLRSASNNVQQPFAPAKETKASNGLAALLSKLFQQKEQEGIVIAKQEISAIQNEEESLKMEQSSQKNNLEFGEFEHFKIEDKSAALDENLEEKTAIKNLEALTVPQNKIQDISQELQEDLGLDGANQFQGKIEDAGQELQESLEINQFEGKIEDKGQELQKDLDVNQFEGKIEDIGQELQEGVEVNQFKGEIEDAGQELQESLEINQFEGEIEDAGQELQEGVEVNQFKGEIEDKGQELQEGVEVNQFKGKIEDEGLGEKLQKGADGEKVFNGVIEDIGEVAGKGLQKEVNGAKEFKGEIEEQQKKNQKEKVNFQGKTIKSIEEDTVLKNISNKRKKEEIVVEQPKTSVSTVTDDDGNITGLNLFLGAQPTQVAKEKGYNAKNGKKQLWAKASKLKKKARSVSDRKDIKINMSR